jgi:5-formyltetrahydrofolate cyclo-ligase
MRSPQARPESLEIAEVRNLREMTKSELRKHYLEKRRKLSAAAEHSELSLKIAEHFFSNFDLETLTIVHCFLSLKQTGEVETSTIFERLWREFPQIKTVAPRVNEKTGEIDALEFARDTRLVENKWKIPEPAEGNAVEPNKIDIVLVPLLCFDLLGFRVGYGKGFYDKFLIKCRPDCLKVGLSFFPPVERIDDIHDGDVPLNSCITPDGLILRNQ